MKRGTRTDTLTYLDGKWTLRQAGWWCGDCGEAVFEGPDLARRERAFFEQKCKETRTDHTPPCSSCHHHQATDEGHGFAQRVLKRRAA